MAKRGKTGEKIRAPKRFRGPEEAQGPSLRGGGYSGRMGRQEVVVGDGPGGNEEDDHDKADDDEGVGVVEGALVFKEALLAFRDDVHIREDPDLLRGGLGGKASENGEDDARVQPDEEGIDEVVEYGHGRDESV